MKGDNIKKFFIYFFLALGAIVMVFPFYWMISGALKTAAEYNSYPPVWVPSNWLNFDNFVRAFQKAPFQTYFLNSLLVTLCSVTLTGIVTILGAFAFSRLRFPGRELIFSFLLAFMMVPFEMMVITNYQTVTKMGIINTIPVLIVPFTTSIFYTYILKNFFDTIPDSLYYSARIDGASNWKYLWRIMVPIAKPSLVTIMLLNAISSWNSFLWTSMVINSDKYRTIPLGLFAFMTEGGSDPKLQLAASTVSVLPMIILFLFARKYIVNGVARGGLKG
ncbi:MAG: carbohydrate ABC transporter permease [Erysipelotrichaceae bacterium]|nr:carbohydrate ABC transporter permease [Erysipelotrichaceae bacterium]